MKIKKFLSQHRSDFTAIMECEHCGHESKLDTGYHDAFYHERVIPAMHCGKCGKNRAGYEKHTDVAVSPMTV
jgi:transcription elongation factor Elf1